MLPVARVVSLALGLFVVGCAKQPTTPQPATLANERISDESGEMQVALAYLPKGDMIEFSVELKGVGTQEMDKVVAEVVGEGFVYVDGEAQWSGFVPPMTKQRHQVVLRVLEDVEFATVKVTVSRSVDSHVLMQTEVPFQVSNGSVVPAQ